MSFGAYLIGSWEGRLGVGTSLQIINPMVYDLNIRIAFLDENEHFLLYKSYELSPNDLVEINVPELKLSAKFGVVKIISHKNGNVKEGIVGFQRQILLAAFEKDVEVAFSEAPLSAVPNMEFAIDEFKRLDERCP